MYVTGGVCPTWGFRTRSRGNFGGPVGEFERDCESWPYGIIRRERVGLLGGGEEYGGEARLIGYDFAEGPEKKNVGRSVVGPDLLENVPRLRGLWGGGDRKGEVSLSPFLKGREGNEGSVFVPGGHPILGKEQ